MGCSESKDIQRISVSDANRKLTESIKSISSMRPTSASSDVSEIKLSSPKTSPKMSPKMKAAKDKMEFGEVNLDSIPANFESIPVNDLGESLDARRMTGLWNQSGISNSTAREQKPASSSALSNNSSDSGIYDLDEDYSFVITETSPPELIRKVENDFTPVENIDLTITGKACPRLLSGTQKQRQEEQLILKGLREEGFIATSKQRSGGGISFDIIEATPQTESASSGKFKPKDFLPESHKRHLEEQRSKYNPKVLTTADMQKKIYEAHERRQQALDAKKETLATKNKQIEEATNLVNEQKTKTIEKMDAAMQKREAHLKELRDKLKDQNKKAQTIKLKKLINGPPVPVRVPVGRVPRSNSNDDFFD